MKLRCFTINRNQNSPILENNEGNPFRIIGIHVGEYTAYDISNINSVCIVTEQEKA